MEFLVELVATAAQAPPKMAPVKFPVNPLLVVAIVAVPALIYYVICLFLPESKKRKSDLQNR